MSKGFFKVLTIAGSDSGGGAGIQADLKTISACGCYGMSAITAITVQNTVGVHGIHTIPVEVVKEQIKAVLDDIGANAIKIGMLHSSEVIKGVAQTIEDYKIENIVLDPVMVATSGDKLLMDEAIIALKEVLIPRAKIITPNLPEAEILSGQNINSFQEMQTAARMLGETFSCGVLLKGGHSEKDEIIDVFFDPAINKIIELRSPRVKTKNTHGTGCTLSSAVASFLAKGHNMETAVREAKSYIKNAIISGSKFQIGQGHGPVNHFFKFW
jgi:hydroxymethylpyrimidine/phosphomethylpyrimidine kinase